MSATPTAPFTSYSCSHIHGQERWSCSAAGPFFVKTDGSPLYKSEFVAAIRKPLAAIGYADKEYAGHSFRIGAATAAANAGLEDSTIRMLGRWSRSAFLSYIHLLCEQLANHQKVN